MRRIRFRLWVIMLAIALAAIAMGAIRFVLWVSSEFGWDFLLNFAFDVTLYVYIPIAAIIELFFFAGLWWFRRKPFEQALRKAGHAPGSFR